MIDVKVYDSEGNACDVLSASLDTRRGVVDVRLKTPQEHAALKPDVDRLFKYIFSALMDYDLINHRTTVGRARNLVSVIVAGAAEDIFVPTNDADPKTRPE